MRVGIIGGSGLDQFAALTEVKSIPTATQWGLPSAPILHGQIAGLEVLFLARHGHGLKISPSLVNYRANIQALKDLGCSHILATTAVGSLREEIKRGDLVVLDQFIDFTKSRKLTFHEYFTDGPVHTSLADPFDAQLRQHFIKGCQAAGLSFHPKGTVVTIEGPRFSTRAESHMFRILGGDVINMSVATEAILAGEAGLPYAAIAMSTDYDSWKDDEAPVTWAEILQVFQKNSHNVTKVLEQVLMALAKQGKTA